MVLAEKSATELVALEWRSCENSLTERMGYDLGTRRLAQPRACVVMACGRIDCLERRRPDAE